jgi:ABC-type nitrate/sulfonate/bicarbonate transport system permease component
MENRFKRNYFKGFHIKNKGCKAFFLKLLVIIFFLTGWEIAGQLRLINIRLLPPPSTLVNSFLESVRTGILLSNLIGSLYRVIIGFGLAVFMGVISGIILGLIPGLGYYITPVFDLLRPIPPIAWIPIAILWFGLGNGSAIFIIFIGSIFPIFLNTYAGIQSIPSCYINAARCIGANKLHMVIDIFLPGAMPLILTGIRIGIGTAWMSVIASEMVGTHDGLGYAIQLNRIMLNTEAVIVNMMIIGIVGWLMNKGVLLLEKQFTAWNANPK